jgi:phosphoribosyl 1,2-cyclic phosphodiesterase
MVTVSVLGSGSRGNATFIRTEQVRLLIDAGMSRKETARRLELIGEDPNGIDAVFITHEHGDHAAGLKTLMKDLPVQAYVTYGALRALNTDQYELAGSKFIRVVPGVAVTIGDVEVLPFRVPHDAAEPVAFSVTCGGIKITQLTDIGYMPEFVANQLRGSHVLILESNHDLEMLRVGPYPWSLKQRLMGRYGHLSNTAVAKFIREQYDGKAEVLLLAHLSLKNNHPELARREVSHALSDRGFGTDCVRLTHQDQPTEPIRL